jgi:hypothetical protein
MGLSWTPLETYWPWATNTVTWMCEEFPLSALSFSAILVIKMFDLKSWGKK